jgi:hypothetical protein
LEGCGESHLWQDLFSAACLRKYPVAISRLF